MDFLILSNKDINYKLNKIIHSSFNTYVFCTTGLKMILWGRNIFCHFKNITITSCFFLFQMEPTRCTLLLSIFISTSLHVSSNYVPLIRRTYCVYATLVFFTLYVWLAGLQTRQTPTQSEKYQCRIDTVSSPDDGRTVARNIQRSWNKYIKKYCAPSWLHLKKDYTGIQVNKTMKS